MNTKINVMISEEEIKEYVKLQNRLVRIMQEKKYV